MADTLETAYANSTSTTPVVILDGASSTTYTILSLLFCQTGDYAITFSLYRTDSGGSTNKTYIYKNQSIPYLSTFEHTDKIVLEALNQKRIKNLVKFDNIKTEAKFSDKTRFDFLISNNKKKCFLEVKNVTLVRNNKIAEFPDAITSRGTRHLEELIRAKKNGFESYILYLIQREDCESFKIAEDIDQKYKIIFNEALKNGVKMLCYDCKLSNEEIRLNNQINYE